MREKKKKKNGFESGRTTVGKIKIIALRMTITVSIKSLFNVNLNTAHQLPLGVYISVFTEVVFCA